MSTAPKITVHHLQVGQGERIPFLLEELGIPYELKLYQRNPIFSPPELKELHPMEASPVIEDTTDTDNPVKLAESGAVVEYIIQKYGNGVLSLPPTHPNYADYLYWLHFSNGNLQPTIFRKMLVGSLVRDEDDPRYKMNNERMQRALKHIDERLSNNTYLAGDEFTAADVMSVWCMSTMRKFQPMDLTDYPGILKWLKTCTDRPAYRVAMSKGDPDLVIEELISAKGPAPFAPFTKGVNQSK